MIFEELVLTDVGPFAGEHRIPLAPRSADQPVILVGGLNGSGKTTVLESLLLALYGGMTPASARRATSHDRYLRQLINRYADPSRGASVELAFRAIHDGAWHAFRVRRWWWISGDRVRDAIDVARDGAPDAVLAEAWPDHVETLAPRGVANLFFFDGEQIEAFADLDVARELVRTAIGGLLGLDLVDRLQEDLLVLERRKRTDALAGLDEQRILHRRQEALAEVRQRELDARQTVDEIEREVARAQHDVDKASQRLVIEGGERYRLRDELITRRQDAAATLKQSQAGLQETLGGMAPLLLVAPLLTQAVTQARAERREAENESLAETLTERDAQLIDVLQQQRAAARVQQAVVNFLAADVARRKSDNGVPRVLGVQPAPQALAEKLLAGELDDEQEHLRHRLDDLQKAREALDDADRAVAAIPAADAVEQSLDEHGKASHALAEARARLEVSRRELEEITDQRVSIDRSIQRELVQASESMIESEEARRVVDHAARARTTLARLRAAAMQRHTKRIETLILDSLEVLLRKEKLVREVRIDPDTCAVELFTHDGLPLRPKSLSAGERQLLAVSLLAGLARASGRLLPVVIDTPLGRLDGDHRHRLIGRYIPHASHQVIVLSTDTEITPETLEHLGSSVSHILSIDFDSPTHSSVVREGYFEEPLGASRRRGRR